MTIGNLVLSPRAKSTIDCRGYGSGSRSRGNTFSYFASQSHSTMGLTRSSVKGVLMSSTDRKIHSSCKIRGYPK